MIDSSIVERIGWMLLHSVWQIALVAILFAVINSLMKRRSANARYLTGCVALLAMVALPVMTFVTLPPPNVSPHDDLAHDTGTPLDGVATPTDMPVALPGTDTPTRLKHEPDELVNQRTEELLAASPDADETKMGFQERFARLIRPSLPPVVAAWLIGVLLLSLRPMIGLYTVQRLRRVGLSAVNDTLQEILRTTTARMHLNRGVEIAQSALVQVPAVIGYFRPLILLPASAVTGLTREQLEAVIAHELAHVRRHDYLVNLLQTAIETLLFYHPAVWWILRHVRRERENCCDDLALAVCDDAVDYADALVAVDQLCAVAPQPALSAGGGSLLERIRRIAGHSSPAMHAGNSWMVWLLTPFFVAAVALPIALIYADNASEKENEPPRPVLSAPDTFIDGSPIVVRLSMPGSAEWKLDESRGKIDDDERWAFYIRINERDYKCTGGLFPFTSATIARLDVTDQLHNGPNWKPGKYRVSYLLKNIDVIRNTDGKRIHFAEYESNMETFDIARSSAGLTTEKEFVVHDRDETAWSKAVDGIQLRLRPEKTVWTPGETPAFVLDIRNAGDRAIGTTKSQSAYEVAFEDHWYRAGEQQEIEQDAIERGETRTAAVRITLDENKWISTGSDLQVPGELASARIDARLPLKMIRYGRYTVRVAYFHPIDPDKGTRVVSNPVTFEVVANNFQQTNREERKPSDSESTDDDNDSKLLGILPDNAVETGRVVNSAGEGVGGAKLQFVRHEHVTDGVGKKKGRDCVIA